MAAVDYGYCDDDVNKVNKNFTIEGSLNGTFNRQFDVKSPILFVRGHYSNFNYVYVPDLKRYYYVDDVTIITNNYYELHLIEDVLYTYRDDISKTFYGGNVKRIDSDNANPFKNSYNVIVTVEGGQDS